MSCSPRCRTFVLPAVPWPLVLVFLLFAALVGPAPAHGLVKTLHVEWQYDTSLPGLAGFRIYQDGQMVHEVADPTALATDITVTLTGDASFTMTAFDTDNLESAHSDPYLLPYSDVNTPPQAADGTFLVDEDSQVSGTLAATDAEGDGLTFTVTDPPAHGTVTITDPATGAFTYTPTADYNGTDSFIFTVSDGWAQSQPATAAITVKPVNDPPVVSATPGTTDEDTVLSGTVSGQDVDGDTLTFAVSTPPTHGTVDLDPATGVYTYTPAPDYSGSDTFAVTASDGTATTGPVTVEVTINPVNDAPVAQVATLARQAAGATVTLDGSASSDKDDGIATVSWRQVSGPLVQLAGSDTLTPTFTTPVSGPRGTPLVFELTVTDNGGLTATATTQVQVAWPLPSPGIRALAAR